MHKIILGTVQLGLSYGINNQTGKPDRDEAFRIFNLAHERGITILDSAEAYGDSLETIGLHAKKLNRNFFETISKFSGGGLSLATRVNETLKAIRTEHLYAYMFHRYSDYLAGNFKDELLEIKANGFIQRIGVSLYSLDELQICMNDPYIDVIQIPLNPFDASKKKTNMLKEAKLNGKEIHTRSIFLQGLFFKSPKQLTGNLIELSKPLEKIHSLAKKYNLDIQSLCLNFAIHQTFVDRVIIGVEKHEQLIQNIESIMDSFPAKLLEEIESLEITSDMLLNPSNWQP